MAAHLGTRMGLGDLTLTNRQFCDVCVEFDRSTLFENNVYGRTYIYLTRKPEWLNEFKKLVMHLSDNQ